MYPEKIYLIMVNLGSADHSMVSLTLDDSSFEAYYLDDFGDHYYAASDVKFGEVVGSDGILKYFAGNLEEAEYVQTGVWMVRKMLRNWIDS